MTAPTINSRYRSILTIQDAAGVVLGLLVFALGLAASLIAGQYEFIMSKHIGNDILALVWGLVLFIYCLSTIIVAYTKPASRYRCLAVDLPCLSGILALGIAAAAYMSVISPDYRECMRGISRPYNSGVPAANCKLPLVTMVYCWVGVVYLIAVVVLRVVNRPHGEWKRSQLVLADAEWEAQSPKLVEAQRIE